MSAAAFAASPLALGEPEAGAAAPGPVQHLDPAAALRRLAAGNRRFVRGEPRHPRPDSVRRAALAEGQAPFAIVLSCADSRVPPEIVYDAGLGELFVVRIAGNTGTDPVVIGSVEYAATVLGSAALVVLGHEQCGAVKAAIEVASTGTSLPGDLDAVVAPIVPVVTQLSGTPKDALLDAATKANVRQTVADLSAVQLLADLVAQNKLVVVGREYILASGRIVPVT
jgi:carbonic anhydrase